MASYHFRAEIIGRKKGYSAVAAAAYRAGEKLVDERAGIIHDYSKRQGVQHTEIMMPEGANAELGERSTLWNLVERMEKRSDAQLCRSVVLALPHELTDEQRLTLTREFVQAQFVNQGMVADVAIHTPTVESHKNHHAHVLLTLRQPSEHGLRATKTREWNSRSQVDTWREEWANAQNTELEKHGHDARVDHRTLEAQKIEAKELGDHGKADALDRIPEESLGQEAWHMAKEDKFEREYEEAEHQYEQSEADYSQADFSYEDAEQALAEFDALAYELRTDYKPANDELENSSSRTPTPLSSSNWQTARKEQIRERLLKMELTGVMFQIYGDKSSPAMQANQIKFQRFQYVIQQNRQTMRDKRDLWQRRRALFSQRRSAYERFFAAKTLGLDFGEAPEKMSTEHVTMRLYQLNHIHFQIEGALAKISRQQLRLEMRQQMFECELAPYRREMEQNEMARPERERQKQERKAELEQELRNLTFGTKE